MKTDEKIIDFKAFKVVDDDINDEKYKANRNFNLAERVVQLKKRCEAYDNDTMIGVEDWDGDCFRTFFETACKGIAGELGLDQWDVFAAFVHEIFEG